MQVDPSANQYEDHLTAGLIYIAAHQNPDGSFAVLGEDVFLHATILQAIANLLHPTAQQIGNQLANWLMSHYRQQPPHIFFGALSAIQAYDEKLIDGEILGRAARLLVGIESTVGGPYRSKPGVNGIIEPVTNAFIAQFISRAAEPLPKVTAYLQQTVSQPASVHYAEDLATIYQLARAIAPRAIHTQLEARLPEANSLQLALIISSLRILNLPVPALALQALASAQQADGSWPAGAYRLPDDPPLIATALALEALARKNNRASSPTIPASIATFHTPQGNKLYQHIFDQTSQLFREPALYGNAVKMLERIRAADTNQEILLLPYFFQACLRDPRPAPPDQFFIQLGIANLCNWMAFTIYDDFYDEAARPAMLPVANAALHHALEYFDRALPGHIPFRQLVHRTFDQLDSANAWEIATCRMLLNGPQATVGNLPVFAGLRKLADRSYTHLLPTLAVLAYHTIDLHGPAGQAIQVFGRHYLISRQLNDDMHDWEEDLRAGNLTYTLAVTCRELGLGAGQYAFEDLFIKIRQQFWQHTIISICNDLAVHINLGQQAVRRSGLLTEVNVLEILFASLQRTLEHTRRQHQQSMNFLKTFGTSSNQSSV